MFDTGSADVWVYSQQGCDSTDSCPDRKYYDEGVSANYKLSTTESGLEEIYRVYYAMGNVEGPMVQDSICFPKKKNEDKTTNNK